MNVVVVCSSSVVIEEAIVTVGRELGYIRMKKEQIEVLQSIVEGRDVFGVLPTGFGMSLCYASLPGAFDKVQCKDPGSSIVLIVILLTSIMKDQLQPLASVFIVYSCKLYLLISSAYCAMFTKQMHLCRYLLKGLSAAYVSEDSSKEMKDDVRSKH